MNEIENGSQLGILCQVVLGPVSFATQRVHLFGRQPNRKNWSSPTSSRISMLAPSMVPMVKAPFIANFILPRAGGLFACQGNLLRQFSGGIHPLAERHAVVRQEHAPSGDRVRPDRC